MAFGVTNTGFNRKRLEDIQRETTDSFQEDLGVAFDLSPTTPQGQIKNINDSQVAELWQVLEDVYNSTYPATSEGINLDNVVSYTGTTRKPALRSLVLSGRARGVLNTPIPNTFQVTVENNVNAVFQLNSSSSISNPARNEVQNLNFSGDTILGISFTLTFRGQTTSPLQPQNTLIEIRNALSALDTIGSGNINVGRQQGSGTNLFFVFTGNLGNQSIGDLIEFNTQSNVLNGAVTVATRGDVDHSDLLSLTCTVDGPTQALAGTLNNILTPIIGIDSFTNELDATLGAHLESDADLKIRRLQELAIAGASTPDAIVSELRRIDGVNEVVTFRNRSNVTDAEDRPPHSIDVIVQGGTNQDIGQGLHNSVADGIETIGPIAVTVVDSQGFDQVYRFSRPIPVEVYLRVMLTKNLAEFPDNGEDQITNAILEYSNGLVIGRTVIIYGTNSLISIFNDIPGIVDVELLIGREGMPTLDNNLILSDREIAVFNSSRITFSELAR